MLCWLAAEWSGCECQNSDFAKASTGTVIGRRRWTAPGSFKTFKTAGLLIVPTRSPHKGGYPSEGIVQIRREHLSRQTLFCQEKYRAQSFAGSGVLGALQEGVTNLI